MPCAFMPLLFATVAAASTVPAQLDAILKDYGRADAPGAGVLVALDGKVLYRKAFGLANLEERTPITTATNFRLASVTKNIFDPLGMAGTVAYEEGISKVERRAYGYSERDGRFERTDQSLTSSVLGDGGIYSSVDDLWRWDQALYGTRLLPAETLAMAFQAGTPTSDQPGSGYGYGWYVATASWFDADAGGETEARPI